MKSVDYLECQCDMPSHVVRVVYMRPSEDEDAPDLFVSVQLNNELPWWKRVVLAIKYVLGVDVSDYGWAETWLRDESVVVLHKTLQKYFLVKNLRKAIRAKKARQALAAKETTDG